MANDRELRDEKIHQAVEAYFRAGKSKKKAAEILGIPRSTLQERLKHPYAIELLERNEITPEPLPPPDIPAEKIIDMMCERFEQRKQHDDGKKWRSFNVRDNKPIAICWFGDPHVDDNGCNWPLLKKHCKIVAETPGMYGANIGDSTNNWTFRLMKEYANQDTSLETADRLIEWFFRDSGIKWLIMLLGNHDMWNDGGRFIKKLCENICTMVDWRAQFKLVFPNGRECLIDAAHDHKGHSQWNALHGQQKASAMGGVAHLYIAGHRHNWALAQNECSETGRIYHLARVRGYKYIDHYATVNGFGSQNHGASIVTVIDPNADDMNFIRCFADVQEGADFLTYLRQK